MWYSNYGKYYKGLVMKKTYALDELFAVNPKIEHTYENGVITIHNFFENPDDIYEHLQNRQYPMWKYSTERNSPNGTVYNDCRITDKIGHPTRVGVNEMERVLDICRKYWWTGNYSYKHIHEFNCFQTITEFDPKMQHYPHIDSEFITPDDKSTLNMLVYMDKEESGGTAVYKGEWITNMEHMGVLYPVEEDFEIDYIIPAQYNTCVIFTGNKLHGAWIDDYTKYCEDKWRYSYVRFFHPEPRRR
jgi:hypothetical protein